MFSNIHETEANFSAQRCRSTLRPPALHLLSLLDPSDPSSPLVMTSNDVRSILGLPQGGSSSVAGPSKKVNINKRPDGISRELYALIGNNAPSLAEAQASVAAVKYKSRPSINRKKVKWCVDASTA